ncbi:MAG TPA: cytidylate kinase family protein [Usitatibacter sp.]|nr:cytidylate kinase family protein [Usitatibacter sp.]
MPLVAMTREMGSLGKDVAAGVAARSNRKVVYHEIIEPIASKMRLRKSHVERFLDGRAGLWEKLTTDKTSLSIFTADETFRFLRDGQTAVIRGWGAVHLLRNIPHVVRVRICAPLETRVHRMMERLATDNRETVENEINMSEEAHSAITKRHFGVNWRDPELYDLVLCTERLSVEECVDEIDGMMQRKCFQETEDSRRMVEALSTEWAVRSALRRDERTSRTHITIESDNGMLRLMGVVDTQTEANAAGELAAAVEGVKQVDNQLKAANSASSRFRREG